MLNRVFQLLLTTYIVFNFSALYGKDKNNKIKLYTFHTPSHEVLYKDWFLPSLKDDYELIVRLFPQTCPSGKFYNSGWTATTIRKIEMMIDAVNDNMGEIFIYSDTDIQFFRPTQKIITAHMKNNDLLIQKDNPWGEKCTGFFACRANKKMLYFWENVKAGMISTGKSDQYVVNKLISEKKFKIKWAFLPNEFLSGGTLTGKLWSPEKELIIPENIVLHHANWTIGVEHKIAQLKYVKDIVDSRKRKL